MATSRVTLSASAYTKVADAADEWFVAQAQGGSAMVIFDTSLPAASDLGVVIEHGEAVTREHGAGNCYMLALDPTTYAGVIDA